MPEISLFFFFLCEGTKSQIQPFNTNKLGELQSAPCCRLAGGLLLPALGPGLGKKELKDCVGRAAQLPADAEIYLFLHQCSMAGESQFQIQMLLCRPRMKLHPTALIHPLGENQDELSSGLGRWVFISVCWFGALWSVPCPVVLPGWSLRELPSQPGDGGSPDPGDGRWWGKGGLCALRPIPRRWLGRAGCLCRGNNSAHTGRDWGVLGALPRRGGLWDRDGGSAGAQGWMRLR